MRDSPENPSQNSRPRIYVREIYVCVRLKYLRYIFHCVLIFIDNFALMIAYFNVLRPYRQSVLRKLMNKFEFIRYVCLIFKNLYFISYITHSISRINYVYINNKCYHMRILSSLLILISIIKDSDKFCIICILRNMKAITLSSILDNI